jgi:alpha-tubulin suppressor-like RCC1 family protein/ABC-type transport system involved in cytochrome c biogenesis permease component
MTLLPIVERELRVAARQRATYRVRLAIALGALFVGAIVFVLTFGLPAEVTGRHIFEWLSGVLFVYCLAYGRRSTADCLSQEKRDGTLGLLFLTDLKGHDVVLGKVVATSVRGFYGLLAVFPVLAIPILLGGITSGEFWRVVLVLVDTFLFSLAIGVLGSAISRDFRGAMAANFLLLLLLMAAPPACLAAIAYFSPGNNEIRELLFSCPLYPFYLCVDSNYKVAPAHFWWSVGVIHGLTWLLVLLAGWIAPHAWQDQPSRAEKRRCRELWHAWSYGGAAKQSGFRKRLLDLNAFYWLAARARLKPVHAWTFLGCMAGWWLVGWLTSGTLWLDASVAVLTALLLSATLKVWVVIEAGQRLAEDQKAGAFELLLSVPLTVRDILHGQLLALRRQFLGPLVAVLGVEVLFTVVLYSHSFDPEDLAIWVAGMLMLVVDLVALSWVAMWRALVSRSHNFATISTLARVLVLPWALFGAVVGFGKVWYGLSRGAEWLPGWKFYLGLWCGLGLAADLLFGLTAWWCLRTQFRELALRRFNPVPAAFWRWLGREEEAGHVRSEHAGETTRSGTLEKPTRHDEPTDNQAGRISASFGSLRLKGRPGGLRRPRVVVCSLGLVLVCAGFITLRPRSHFPPPVVVPITQSNGPVRVFPGAGGFLFVLPDGSLWHWGQAGGAHGTRVAAPEQVGTNSDWEAASAYGYHAVGLRNDGTIWEWGWRGGAIGGGTESLVPKQAAPGQDWVNVAASGGHSAALRRDGTLWAWGDNSMGQLGIGAGPAQTNLVQVGTNHDWVAVACAWGCTLGLRTDGTLWAWGPFYVFGLSGVSRVSNLPTPTQVCLETNWAGLVPGALPLVRTRFSELWEPFYGMPDPEASASANCRLVVSNATPGRLAGAFCGESMLYELRSDGTLWGRNAPFGPWKTASTGPWRRVGKRSDWVSLWSMGPTAVGMTSDGTVWTWGIDPGQEPAADFLSRLKAAQVRIRGLFGTAPGPSFAVGTPVFQKQPRPLLRLAYTNSTPPARPTQIGAN